MTRARSLLFATVFVAWTAFLCIIFCWALFAPRRTAFAVALIYLRSVAWIERHLLGLTYRVLGRERLPTGAFILACKHQSTFETYKIHLLLDDPAIVMKKELVRLPVFGGFARKLGMIALDRSARGKALGALLADAQRTVDEGRPIVIFPQGTRVPVGERRPYKIGVAVLYDTLKVSIVPLAVNSGLFWPKDGVKHGGVATFEFLDPILPGLSIEGALRTLEERLEAASDRLVRMAADPVPAPAAAPARQGR